MRTCTCVPRASLLSWFYSARTSMYKFDLNLNTQENRGEQARNHITSRRIITRHGMCHHHHSMRRGSDSNTPRARAVRVVLFFQPAAQPGDRRCMKGRKNQGDIVTSQQQCTYTLTPYLHFVADVSRGGSHRKHRVNSANRPGQKYHLQLNQIHRPINDSDRGEYTSIVVRGRHTISDPMAQLLRERRAVGWNCGKSIERKKEAFRRRCSCTVHFKNKTRTRKCSNFDCFYLPNQHPTPRLGLLCAHQYISTALLSSHLHTPLPPLPKTKSREARKRKPSAA